jgi:hypothetical protein
MRHDYEIENENELIKNQRNELIMEIIFHLFKTQGYDKDTHYLEIFVKTYEYAKVYQSLYDLMQMKLKATSSKDKMISSYLNILILKKTRELEEQGKRDIFDIDTAIEIDKNFNHYKELVSDVTLLIQQFWSNLAK